MTMYHREGYQEGFLVLRGECLLIVEGSEVRLARVGLLPLSAGCRTCDRGSGACLSLVLAVGSRVGPDEILYPRDAVALKHGAGVEQDTPHPQEAYARFTGPRPRSVPRRVPRLTNEDVTAVAGSFIKGRQPNQGDRRLAERRRRRCRFRWVAVRSKPRVTFSWRSRRSMGSTVRAVRLFGR